MVVAQNMPTSPTLASLDWAVIGAYALGMLAVGIYYAYRNQSSDDYLLGGRMMKPWAIGLSLFATLLSTVSYLAVPSEMIHRGPMILFGMAAYPLIVLIVGWLLIPRIMQFRVTTAYELLEVRLGPGARILGSSIFVIMRLLWMAVIIFATADKVLVPLAGLEKSATPWVCAIMGIVTLIYTSIGGLQAVVWTDVLQTFILFFGAIACLVVISFKLGSATSWIPTQWSSHWQPFQFWPDGSARLSFVDMSLSALIWYVATSGSDQMAVQRYLSTRNASAARRAYIINMVMDVLVLTFCAALGFALLAYYQHHPQWLKPGETISTAADQLFPRFIVFGLPAGLTGIVVAGLLAAAMSSLSSGMSSITSVISVDFVNRMRASAFSDLELLPLAKVVSMLVGAATVILSVLFVRQVGGNLLEVGYKVTNFLTAPLFILFIMALFCPWATGSGAIVGTLVASAVAILIAYWQELTNRPGLAFTWIMPGSLLAGIATGTLASLIHGEKRPMTVAAQSPAEVETNAII